MPKRKRSRVGQRSKRPIKRKRPMDPDICTGKDLASPHEGDLHNDTPVDLRPALKRMFYWCYNKLPSARSAIGTVTELIYPRSQTTESGGKNWHESSKTVKEELEALKLKVKELEMKLDKITNTQKVSTASPVVCKIPPAPPPPPPLPPLVDIKISLPASFKRKKTESTVNQTKTSTITLDDILKVKLKKASTEDLSSDDKENEGPLSMPRVTLSDLTSVMLRSSRQKENVEASNNVTPKSVLLQRTLRKTAMERSPGGTPLVKRDNLQSTGTGPTPEFTMALRRKFRSIRSSPLLETEGSPSPR